MLIFTLVNTAWSSLELAHSVGVEKGLQDVAKPIGTNLADTEASKGLVPSVTHYFDNNEKSYLGKIIFSNSEITVLTTKDASYLFDKSKNIIAKSIKLDEAKIPNKTIKKN